LGAPPELTVADGEDPLRRTGNDSNGSA